jgi:uncharacterized membrane protein YheB (UPF0754 family)
MDTDIDSIVKKMDIKKLIEERIESKIEDYICRRHNRQHAG